MTTLPYISFLPRLMYSRICKSARRVANKVERYARGWRCAIAREQGKYLLEPSHSPACGFGGRELGRVRTAVRASGGQEEPPTIVDRQERVRVSSRAAGIWGELVNTEAGSVRVERRRSCARGRTGIAHGRFKGGASTARPASNSKRETRERGMTAGAAAGAMKAATGIATGRRGTGNTMTYAEVTRWLRPNRWGYTRRRAGGVQGRCLGRSWWAKEEKRSA
ncbi:hypothetical protein DFH09DRAFT_1474666 [Mycena vulgaris]|nr:hypothetical protein DFH09DRAFT_1474666 [Mycena vulgaris]